MFVHDFLHNSALARSDKTALIVNNRPYTFRQIDEDSDRLAAQLQLLGAKRGDRIAAMLDNSAEMAVALWAALKAGCAFVPINNATKSGALAFIVKDAEPRCLILHPLFRSRAKAAFAEAPDSMAVIWTGPRPEPRPGDNPSPQANGPRRAELELADILAGPRLRPSAPRLIDQDLSLIIYTSGSTGRPKGVMMSHRAICNNARSISTYLGNTPEDVVLCVLPLSFDYGLFQILTGARVGFTIVLEPSFAFPAQVMKLIGAHRVTGLPGVPTIFARMLQLAPFDDMDLSSLRYITNTAAAFPPAHIRQLRALLPHTTIFSMYGVTESTRTAFLDPAKLDSKPSSVGKAIPNLETFILDEDGRQVAPGQIGELAVRGSGLMHGYWRQPEATAAALREHSFAPGEKLYHTGDLFWADEDGDLYFVGRRDDVFKCRGEKVSPREVENALYELPEIAEAAVIGVPDAIDGLAVKAFIVLHEGRTLSESALRLHCRGRLEPWLQPKFFEFCPSLPKTDSGKITRHPLRAEQKGAI